MSILLLVTLVFTIPLGTVGCLRQSSSIKNIQIVTQYSMFDDSESESKSGRMNPIVINTWGFTDGTAEAWSKLVNGGSALDAVEAGCSKCEELQCDRTVGFGGSPDENGETTLDAMIMDGETHDVGAVACLRRIKSAISVARKVLEHTKHSMLSGELATNFAVAMGFKEESLSTRESEQMHADWKKNSCQPNFWKNVYPDPAISCGPYKPAESERAESPKPQSNTLVDRFNHDTIGMLVIDGKGRIASGTSSNGARNKIPGRVGDSPLVGAGSYVDKEVGGAAATGDGDVMMRFLPSLIAVEKMRGGLSPTTSAEEAIARIVKFYPNFSGAIVTLSINGEYGAACHGLTGGFPFSVMTSGMNIPIIKNVTCSSYLTYSTNQV